VATPPVTRPPIGTPINPGGIVPVDRGQIRQDRQAEQAARRSERFGDRMQRLSDRFGFPLPPNFGADGVVPVDRGQMQAWIQSLRDRMGPGRENAVKRVLGNPRTRALAAKVGGAIVGRARAENNPGTALQAQQALEAAYAAKAAVPGVGGVPADALVQMPRPVAKPLPVAPIAKPAVPVATTPSPYRPPIMPTAAPAMTPQQRLQEFISARALPAGLPTNLSGLLGRR